MWWFSVLAAEVRFAHAVDLSCAFSNAAELEERCWDYFLLRSRC